jgi:hypothetical protein
MLDFKQTSRSRRVSLEEPSVRVDIPATFTEAQAETILAISRISATDSGFAEQLLQAWTPERFTEAQARCVHEMLKLHADDLRATIADAMEPCALRQRLRLRSHGEPAPVPAALHPCPETDATHPSRHVGRAL